MTERIELIKEVIRNATELNITLPTTLLKNTENFKKINKSIDELKKDSELEIKTKQKDKIYTQITIKVKQ